MSAAYPWALAALAALPAIWWWHRARQRPRDLEWPSLLLWKRLPAPDPAAIARHRRRADAALWLALAGVVALVVGAAKLSVTTLGPAPVRVGVVADATASARGAFREIHGDATTFLKGLPGDAVVDLAVVPVGAWTGLKKDDALAKLALAGFTDAPGDPAAAAARMAGDDLVVAFSDRPGPDSVAVWRVHPSGTDTHGVESLTIEAGELFCVLRGTNLSATVTLDGVATTHDLAAGPDGRALLRLPSNARAASVELSPDGFPSNDLRAWAAHSDPTPVGIAGRDFPALRRALEGAGLRPELGGTPSIWIGVVPEAPPAGPAILIDPPKGIPGLFEVEGELTAPEPRVPELGHPLVKVAAAADLPQLQAARARRLKFAKPPVVLVDPLVYLCDRTLVLAFDPSAPNSNWPRLVSFPLFWADAAKIFRPSAGRTLSTGASLPDRDGPRPFLRAGLFLHNATAVAVNLDDAQESAAPAAAASPRLDLPSKNVIRSSRTVPPAGGAIAGLILLVLSWLAARPRPR